MKEHFTSSTAQLTGSTATIRLILPGNPCWFGNIEIQPLLVLPAKILPCGVGSSVVPELIEIYPAQPSSHIITVLFSVAVVIVLMTLSLVSVLRVMFPALSYSVIMLRVEAHPVKTTQPMHIAATNMNFFISLLSFFWSRPSRIIGIALPGRTTILFGELFFYWSHSRIRRISLHYKRIWYWL